MVEEEVRPAELQVTNISECPSSHKQGWIQTGANAKEVTGQATSFCEKKLKGWSNLSGATEVRGRTNGKLQHTCREAALLKERTVLKQEQMDRSW